MIAQVPAETPVTTPVVVSIRHTEIGDTAKVTAPPERAVADRTNVPSIGKSLMFAGEITGSFAVNAEVALTTCGVLAAVLSPSPTALVAETLIVYVPAARPVKSAAKVVTVLRCAVTSLFELSYRYAV